MLKILYFILLRNLTTLTHKIYIIINYPLLSINYLKNSIVDYEPNASIYGRLISSINITT